MSARHLSWVHCTHAVFLCAPALTLSLFTSNARAASVTFDFNSLSSGATSGQIATYMTAVLVSAGCNGCTVHVTGAVADRTYNGEGHVTGPGTWSRSLTLGTSDGAAASNTTSPINSSYDTFLANTTDSSTQIAQQITIKFAGFTLAGLVSFDYEIFPDGSCSSLTSANCGGTPHNGIYPNQPDMEFEAGTNNNGSDPLVNSFGNGGVQYGVQPGTTDGDATHSPLSGNEVSPQYIGTWSGTFSNLNNAELDFIDWPATIAVDNLTVSWDTPAPVPEPASIVLLASITAVVFRKRIRKV